MLNSNYVLYLSNQNRPFPLLTRKLFMMNFGQDWLTDISLFKHFGLRNAWINTVPLNLAELILQYGYFSALSL